MAIIGGIPHFQTYPYIFFRKSKDKAIFGEFVVVEMTSPRWGSQQLTTATPEVATRSHATEMHSRTFHAN